MLDALAPGVAVLGTTATANDRVVADVRRAARPRSGGEPLRSYRGPLARDEPAPGGARACRGPPQRLAWLVENLPSLPGSGIVYTLTKRDAEQVAAFLAANGISAVAYSGEQETERADRAPRSCLLRNEIKAVVATSALGMGYDKADLTFVVHYQAPGSVDLLLPAGRPRRPRRRARRHRPAARRRGPPDPGLLHRAGVSRPRARDGGARRAGARRRARAAPRAS